MKLKLLIATISLTLAACGGSSNNSNGGPGEPVIPPPPTYDFSSIKTTAEAELLENNAAAVSIAIMKDGEVIYAEAFGDKGAGMGAPDKDTLFQLGSTTKMFTSLGVLKLADEGKFSMQDSVTVALPGIDYPSDYADYWADIEVHELLSMQSGLLELGDYLEGMNGNMSALDFAVAGFPQFPPMTRAGRFYSYSNPNYIYGGALIEHHSGEQYSEWMKQQVFTPLGMTNSTLNRADVQSHGNFALGKDDGGSLTQLSQIQTPTFALPAGAETWSTPSEMLKMANFLMEGNEAVASDSARQALVGKHAPMNALGGEAGYYGYGVMTDEGLALDGSYYPISHWQHGGNTDWYTSAFYVFPEQKVAISVLSSGEVDAFEKVVKSALVELEILPAATDLPYPQVDSAKYPHYTGTYQGLSVFGEVTFVVTHENDKLMVSVPELDADGTVYNPQLIPLRGDAFFFEIAGLESFLFTFRNADDSPQHEIMSNRLAVLHLDGFQP